MEKVARLGGELFEANRVNMSPCIRMTRKSIEEACYPLGWQVLAERPAKAAAGPSTHNGNLLLKNRRTDEIKELSGTHFNNSFAQFV